MHQFAFAGFGTAGNYVNRGSKRYRLCKCEGCGKQFHPKKYRYIRFCSRKCFSEALKKKIVRPANFGKSIKKPKEPRKCSRCGLALDKPRVLMHDACKRVYIPAPRTVSGCTDCGASIYGTKAKRICEKCSRKRHRAAQTANGKRAAQRKARKIKKRGVTVEIVNDLHVLQRDGWRCQLCGVKTPKRLRGTFEDRAPEVDHIIPIACGGEHSYRNVQCACRKCNLAKGFVPLGQQRLFG